VNQRVGPAQLRLMLATFIFDMQKNCSILGEFDGTIDLLLRIKK
jgi:hypothetical protein